MDKGKEVINEPFWAHPDGEREIIMNTYITKQQAIVLINRMAEGCTYLDITTKEVIDGISAIPAADVAPVVRGKWTLFGRRGIYGVMYECSACHAKYDGITNFCPNCGADMRGNDG